MVDSAPMTPTTHEAALIVGAGPIGLACAISARRRGGDPLVVDAGAIVNSIVHYPIGMVFFTTPERLEIGGHPLVSAGSKATREEALKYYRGVARAEGLRVRPFTRLIGVDRQDGILVCRLRTRLREESLSCDRLVLATGYFDHPNPLGVPGEDLPHVSHYFEEPHLTAGQDVVIVGGKNSAAEAALLAFRAGARVTLVYRRPELRPSIKYWLRPDLENRIKAGEIQARLGADVVEITPTEVVVEGGRAAGRQGGMAAGEQAGTGAGGQDGKVERIPADRVYALTGYHPDFDLFRAIGIRFDDETGRPALDPATLETNVPGVHLAGSVTAGRNISEVFIENGRFDGEKIFGDRASRAWADALYAATLRAQDE